MKAPPELELPADKELLVMLPPEAIVSTPSDEIEPWFTTLLMTFSVSELELLKPFNNVVAESLTTPECPTVKLPRSRTEPVLAAVCNAVNVP